MCPEPPHRTPVRGAPAKVGSPVPAVALVLGSALSVQLGAAIAFNLFDAAGPEGTVLLRVGLAALILGVLWRPSVRGHTRAGLAAAALFGVALAAMNLSFYLALERIPLGIAVTLEFVGPLGVAVAGSRRARDLVWVALAAAGIVLLSPGVGGSLDLAGAGFALLAGAFWASYIPLSARVGREFTGASGLTLALFVATALLLPVGLGGAGSELGSGHVLAAGLAVAVLSSAIPYSLVLEALRRIRTGVFGVLMSLEPAVAATVGFAVLDQDLSATDLAGMALVVIASAGALRRATAPPAIEA